MIYVSLFPNIALPLLKNQNMAKITVQKTDANAVIANWLRNRMTIEYLGLWEILYNPHFKEGVRKGYPPFFMQKSELSQARTF